MELIEKNEEFDEIDKLSIIKELENIDYSVDIHSKLYLRMSNIVHSFYNSFENESSLCLYYVYYLLNLKGNKDYEYEFKTLENKLYDDFYYYGIYSILRELKHVVDAFPCYKWQKNVITKIFDSIHYSEYSNKFIFDTEEMIKTIDVCTECTGIKKSLVHDIIKIYLMFRFPRDLRMKSERSNDIYFCYLVEKYFGYFTNPKEILKHAEDIFIMGRERDDKFFECSWYEKYAGEPWSDIAKVIRSREEYASKTIFVDTCWSLQHNNAMWIDKIFQGDIKTLQEYLTDIKDGDFSSVYRCALNYDSRLSRFVYRDLIKEYIKEYIG